MKQTLKFEVELDENNLPNSIKMLEKKESNSSIDLKASMSNSAIARSQSFT